MTCEEFKVTSAKEGESLRHFSVKPGDVCVVDRGYSYRGQIAHVVGKGGDVVAGTGLTNPPSFNSRGRPFNVLAHIRRLGNGELGDWDVWFEHEDTVVKGRICAVRKSLAARKAARARCLKDNGKKGRKVKHETLEAAEYVIVFTTLHHGFTAETVLEFYRSRWQVEPAFKRLKSILGMGNLKKFDPEAARAWLHGKLLVAALTEALIAAGSALSPWDFQSEPDTDMDRSLWKEVLLMMKFFLRAVIPWAGMQWPLRNWRNISRRQRDASRKRESQMKKLIRTVYQMV
jgi:hypothetical protein